jgi:hypothetical protein
MTRLQSVLARWSAAQEQDSAEAVAERIQASSADEVLRFIDNELGRANA